MATNRTNVSLVIATFDDTGQAEQAIEALHNAGFTSDQMRYSRQYPSENFLQSIKDLLIFPREAQDESLDDIDTMLLQMGIGPNEIRYYTDAVRQGKAVVVVRPDGRDQDAAAILHRNGGRGYVE